jgi:hypothetical protein
VPTALLLHRFQERYTEIETLQRREMDRKEKNERMEWALPINGCVGVTATMKMGLPINFWK